MLLKQFTSTCLFIMALTVLILCVLLRPVIVMHFPCKSFKQLRYFGEQHAFISGFNCDNVENIITIDLSHFLPSVHCTSPQTAV